MECNIAYTSYDRLVDMIYVHDKKSKKKSAYRDMHGGTKGIINSTNTKRILFKIWKNNLTNALSKKEYNNYCKLLSKVIKQAKFIYEKEEI